MALSITRAAHLEFRVTDLGLSLTLAETTEVLAAEGLEPPPPHGASDADVEAWVDRFLSATAPSPELEHADR